MLSLLTVGLGTNEPSAKLMEYISKECCVPAVLDDGLNLIAKNPNGSQFKGPVIITPHLGEMSRLTGKPSFPYPGKYSGYLYGIFKRTWCDLRTEGCTDGCFRTSGNYINNSGNECMAKGGSGDVLSGIIAGLAAGGLDLCESARLRGLYSWPLWRFG